MMKHFLNTTTAIIFSIILVTGCKPSENPNNGSGNNGNNNSDVIVTTYTPQNITWTTADCGGDVITMNGIPLTELGVCWSLEPNPTIEDSHYSTTNWHSPFVHSLSGLKPNNVYHVRAYALRGLEYYYGEEKSFTTEDSDHPCVDLGLPSGTLWADCNLGSGIKCAWGELGEKASGYTWNTYKHCNGSMNQLTKYCNNSNYGYNGYFDNLTSLQSTDDAATNNWGKSWRIPTLAEWNELIQNTTITWTINSGVKGMLFTGTNGNSIFLPADGYYNNHSIINRDKGYYWANCLDSDTRKAKSLYFSIENCQINRNDRYLGFSIRPVLSVH